MKKIELPHIWLVILVIVNILLTLFMIIRKDPSWSLEEMKAGGAENFSMVQQLYNSDVYKQQQKASISQFLGQINGAIQGQQPAPQQLPPEAQTVTQ